MTTTTAPAPRFVGRCTNGHALNVTAAAFDVTRSNGKALCDCGALGIVRGLNVTIKPDHQCGARCTNARGGDCECSCAGQRHGIDRRYTA